MTGSIRNRGRGTWGLTISLGRDQDGKRIRRYYTFKGTKRDAERELRRLLTQLEGGPMPSNERIKLHDWFPRWIEEYGILQGWRQSTFDRYNGVIREHLIPALGNVEVDELSGRHVQRLQVALIKNGMHPKGVQLVRTVLSGAVNYAIAMGCARYNPVREVKAPQIPRKEIVPPSAATVQSMLKIAEEEGHPLFATIFIQACTGIRRGEVLALTWDTVDLDKGEIRVERSVGRRSPGLVVDPPKSERGRRTIILPPIAVEVLRRHLDRQNEHKGKFHEIYEDNNLVFADDIGRFINPMNLTRAVNSLAKRAGQPNMRDHDLRHFHVSLALGLNVPITEVSARAGHSNPSITWREYAHLLPGSTLQAPDAINTAMEQFRVDAGTEVSNNADSEDDDDSSDIDTEDDTLIDTD